MTLHFIDNIRADETAKASMSAELRHPLPHLTHLRSVRLSPGVPLWTASFEDCLRYAAADRARHIGWRYFATGDSEAVAVDIVVRSGKVRFARLVSGPSVAQTVDAIAIAEELMSVTDAEGRLLSVPALFFTGVWMATATGGLCIEIGATGEPRSIDDMVEDLARRAVNRLRTRRRRSTRPSTPS